MPLSAVDDDDDACRRCDYRENMMVGRSVGRCIIAGLKIFTLMLLAQMLFSNTLSFFLFLLPSPKMIGSERSRGERGRNVEDVA